MCRSKDEGFRLRNDDGTFGSKQLKTHAGTLIKKFRETVISIKKDEINNKSNLNYRLHVTMIEKFRHIIVHKNGKIDDISEFIEVILKEACLVSDKARRPEAESIISQYIATHPYAGVVLLLEQRQSQIAGITAYVNRCEHLIDVLLGYALIVTRSVIEHFKFPISEDELQQLA